MPNCFSLTRKAAPEDGPVKLATIDEEICRHLAVPCHQKHWCNDWYNTIGLGLAMGRTFPQLLATARDQAACGDPWAVYDACIVRFLDDHFTTDAWAEVGRR